MKARRPPIEPWRQRIADNQWRITDNISPKRSRLVLTGSIPPSARAAYAAFRSLPLCGSILKARGRSANRCRT
jgi:hypothetical protein